MEKCTMSAKYVWRMDDITPDMNWNSFWKYIDLFQVNNIVPLLGIVPDNKDPNLSVGEKKLYFWSKMRELKALGVVEFAQHGYQHILRPTSNSILGSAYGFNGLTEFAGVPYEIQYEKIFMGKKILESEGINTNVWMAPSHSFDINTLIALKKLNFRAITDGIALYPYIEEELMFVPQQLWKPKILCAGIFTVCLHTNALPESYFGYLKNFLNKKPNSISFSEAAKYKPKKVDKPINWSFKRSFIIARKIKAYRST